MIIISFVLLAFVSLLIWMKYFRISFLIFFVKRRETVTLLKVNSVIYRLTKVSRGLTDKKEHLISSFLFPFLLTIPAASDLHTLTVLMPSAIATIFLIIFDQKICTFFNDHRHPYYSNIGRNGETSDAMFSTLRYQYWSMALLLPIILVVAQTIWSGQ